MDTIAETIKLAPIFKGKVWTKQISFYQDKLGASGEKLLAVCFSKDGLEQLYVTDKRVFTNKIKGMVSNNETSIPLSTISSVNLNSKFVYGKLEIMTSGNVARIEDVPVAIAAEVKNIIEGLKNTTSSTPKLKEKDTFDIADEIRKLKDLLDDGILTQEEFNAKKKQLLGI
ncbi:MAG: SHOCT domain-containing protein [Lysinibacillus sp.]